MDSSKPPVQVPPFALRTAYPAPRVHIPQSDLDPSVNNIHQLQQQQQQQDPQQPLQQQPLQQQTLQQTLQQPLQQQQSLQQQQQQQQPPLQDPATCSYTPPPLTMPDLPSSPRKTLSSTSQAVRNPAAATQPQKKPGAPKPKGAVRAKSGCYTCRIRRKKCDEQPNESGHCQTCVRLRLQCLGFGAKRPDWMRENNSVTELREKIKTFLASQGMIKGHSGSGPRTTDGEPPVLILVDNLQANPPTTPPTPTLSTSSNDGQRQQQGPMTSYVRDNGTSYHHGPSGPPTMPPEQHQYPQQQQQPQTTWSTHLPDLNNPSHPHSLHTHDPALRLPTQLRSPEDILYHTNTAQPQNTLMQSGSLVPSITSPTSQSSWLISNGSNSSSALYSNQYVQQASLHPALESSFSPLYSGHLTYGSDDDLDSPEQPIATLPLAITQYDASIPREQQTLIAHYMSRVLPIQYLLSDSNINRFIYDLIRSSSEARDAACMLAAIHRGRTGAYEGGAVVPAVNTLYTHLFQRLIGKQQPYTEGDAMAGLHAVSTILFAGGRGAWAAFLDVASAYVRGVLADPRFYGPEDVLRRCGESTRFIVKTTMWFDVLASVTTASVPRFLETYRELFDRTRRAAYIDVDGEDPGSASSTSSSSAAGAGAPPAAASAANLTEPPETSMLPIMGCENSIVLAIAEISNLAHWKASQLRRNSLSVPRLVEMGGAIENSYLVPAARSPIQSTAAGAYTHAPAGLGLETHAMGIGGAMGLNGIGMGAMGGVNGMNGIGAMNGMNGMSGMGMNGGAAHVGVNGMGMGMNGLSMHGPAPAPPPPPSPSPAATEVQLRRHLTNDIFRAAARVYLHTVLSGDFPSCPEIMAGVGETIACLRRVPLDSPLVSRSVLRSVVFGICICGCLTDNREQRAFLLQLLETQQGEHVGNVAEVRDLMQRVWARRDGHRGPPVDWREVMREGEALLLV